MNNLKAIFKIKDESQNNNLFYFENYLKNTCSNILIPSVVSFDTSDNNLDTFYNKLDEEHKYFFNLARLYVLRQNIN